jgi:D-tyrosyl-tRNA(Tyr) deacylase
MKIFVQIASYRDPELLPTIRDCINNAKHPENLTFGICWQHDETESMEEFTNDKRFKILDYHWSLSKGLCWARSEIQKLWDNEEYTLQLDSHHRFLQDWDVELIEMMKQTGSEKPIITSYAGMYRPSTNELLNTEPYKMVASNFTPGGTILFRPHSISGWETLDKPIPARFVSGHFFFTIGKHCEEYKYDPNIYFAGDEISLSIRSFTLGYDLFHPHKTVVWHEYTREGRTKHWTDFNDENKNKGVVEKQWWEMDNESKRRLRHMLQEEDNDIDIDWIVKKIIGLRIFNDHQQIMNLSILENGGDILIISQFTLHASIKKGNRPSYIKAAKPQLAISKYEKTIAVLSEVLGKKVEKGIFGADMKVSLINDGPVTILMDSKNKE